jgi:hypothetical protein
MEHPMKRITERLKSRDKVDNLKAGDIISVFTFIGAVEPVRVSERELFRLIITKMRVSTIETLVLFGGISVTQKAGDTYSFAREGLIGANWRMG